jgi:hypothetical protein
MLHDKGIKRIEETQADFNPTVRSEGLHLAGMYKIAKTKFMYHGMALTCSEINKRILKSKRSCFILFVNDLKRSAKH